MRVLNSFRLTVFICRLSVEISQALRQTFEAAVLTELFPQSKIDIYVQVLQSDGGQYTCNYTAADIPPIEAFAYPRTTSPLAYNSQNGHLRI